MPIVRWVIGFPLHRDVTRFRIRRGSFDRPSPGSVRSGFILPCPACSSELLRSRSRASSLDSALSAGVSLLHRGLTGRVHLRGPSHSPARFRPQAFSASRRFAPLPAPRAFFIPRPRPRFSVQGLLPIRSHPGSSPGACLLDVVARALTGRSRSPRAGRLVLEALICESMRCVSARFPLRNSSSFRFSPLLP